MEETDAEKLRNKRLAKLGGNTNSSPVTPSQDSQPTPSSDETPSEPKTQDADRSSDTSPNPFSRLGMKSESQPAPRINISSSQPTPQKREANGTARPHSTSRKEESIDVWEDKQLSHIFRLSLQPDADKDAHNRQIFFLADVRADLVEEKQPILLSTSQLDQALTEAGSAASHVGEKTLDYLLGCWKRVVRALRHLRAGDSETPKREILKEARRLCMSYCIFAVTMPEMFGQEPSNENALARHLLVDPDNDIGICYDFLAEASSRFEEDDSIKDTIVGAVVQLSVDLSRLTMNDDYKRYMTALRSLMVHPNIVTALAESSAFLPENVAAQDVEVSTLLGPFFRLSPITAAVAQNYFSAPSSRDKSYILNAQRALRLTLQTHQGELLEVTKAFLKNKAPRDRLLDWFALSLNLNHKRRAMRPDFRTISTDGFMVNITAILDQLCDPFIDATFSKIDKVDVDYLRRHPRVDTADETKINADQKTSDAFYEQQVEGTNNFISEVFFLTLAAHHYGTEAANIQLGNARKHVKYMEKDVQRFEAERSKYISQPRYLQVFEQRLAKLKEEVDNMHSSIHATQGVLLDELMQTRSMQFMRFVIVWLLRLASGQKLPKESLNLPLPETQSDVFKCLPEYFLEDIVDNFKFITRNMPNIITSTQCEELVNICITFLRNSDYIKSPYLKAGFVTILFHGVWPFGNNSRGVLGDLLNGSSFAHMHLLHALMQFYIEAESTGTHTQFYDKFNIRYEIDQIIKCIWPNVIYRENLAKEASLNTDFFVRFVNLLTNDVTFLLDESFTGFHKIRELTLELRDAPDGSMDATARQEKEEELSSKKSHTKSYMGLAVEFLSMLKLFTEALANAFTMPEIVQRLADMLDYNVDALVGPKQGNLKVDNREEYGFNPQQMVADLLDVYQNLASKDNFRLAVARDGRSYKPDNFSKAKALMEKYGLKSKEELVTFQKLVDDIAAAHAADQQAEEDLGEIPDELLDPIMGSLMEDPVLLPSSKQIVDRSTIRSHLLSDPTDPFNRVPLKIDEVLPAEDMKRQIEEFRASRRNAGADAMDTT